MTYAPTRCPPRDGPLPESGGCVLRAIFEVIGMLVKKRLRFGQ